MSAGSVAGIVGMLLRVPWYRVCTNVLYNTNAAPCIHDAGVAGDDTYDRSGVAQIHHPVDVGSSTRDQWSRGVYTSEGGMAHGDLHDSCHAPHVVCGTRMLVCTHNAWKHRSSLLCAGVW